MILIPLVAAAVAASSPAPPAPPTLNDAVHAIEAGRLDQARLMIGKAVAQGASGPQVDRAIADLALASGKNAEALALYDKLLKGGVGDTLLLERAGIAALRLGEFSRAEALIDRSTLAAGASWRAWNALGVIADLKRDWSGADEAYAHAARLASSRAEVVNNQGWSKLLRGDWTAAADLFERAATLDRRSGRIANNLELARSALSADLPERRPGESGREWAERLNDAGLAAQLLGDRRRAIAAFTQAVEASETWYARAANNLQAAGGGK